MNNIKFVVSIIDIDDDHNSPALFDIYSGSDLVEAMKTFIEKHADCFDVYINEEYDNDQSLAIQSSLEHIMRTRAFHMVK